MITVSIDVSQLDKSRFKHITRRNGAKAVFCDLVLIETPDGKYGDWICKQSVTKEERAAKKEMPILGNGKNFDRKSQSKPQQQSTPAAEPIAGDGPPEGDDVPF